MKEFNRKSVISGKIAYHTTEYLKNTTLSSFPAFTSVHLMLGSIRTAQLRKLDLNL